LPLSRYRAYANPFVYVANGGSDDVSQYDLGRGGLLTPLSPPTVPAAGEFPSSVAVSPDGNSVYVTNQSSDSVSQYGVAADGTLTPKTPASVAAGRVPRGVVVSPDGSSLYVANQHGVSQYDIAKDGTVSPKTASSVAAEGAFGVAVSPDGYSAYAAGSVGASQYDVGRDGALSPKSPATVAAGSEPRGLAVGPARGLTNKKSCKHGGWREFGFPKQGACIRFVKHQRKCAKRRGRVPSA
jgi:6-phosphogluconolactonase (cycloisomerase 2 family)